MLFYAEKDPIIAMMFRRELFLSVSLLEKQPMLFPIFNGFEIRRCILKNFPYNIFFFAKDKQVKIIAVLHQRRKPRKW